MGDRYDVIWDHRKPVEQHLRGRDRQRYVGELWRFRHGLNFTSSYKEMDNGIRRPLRSKNGDES